MEGAETLTRTHFAQAWAMQEGCDWDENVFVARDWAALDPDARAAEEALSGAVTLRALTVSTGLEARGYRALLRLIRTGVLETARREVIAPVTLVQRPGGVK